MSGKLLAQLWRDRLDDYSESEMTVQDWRDFNRVGIHQFYYWRRRIAVLNTASTVTDGWLAAEVVESAPVPSSSGGVSIRIAGAVIELTPGFDPEMLRAVVRALAAQQC